MASTFNNHFDFSGRDADLSPTCCMPVSDLHFLHLLNTIIFCVHIFYFFTGFSINKTMWIAIPLLSGFFLFCFVLLKANTNTDIQSYWCHPRMAILLFLQFLWLRRNKRGWIKGVCWNQRDWLPWCYTDLQWQFSLGGLWGSKSSAAESVTFALVFSHRPSLQWPRVYSGWSPARSKSGGTHICKIPFPWSGLHRCDYVKEQGRYLLKILPWVWCSNALLLCLYVF